MALTTTLFFFSFFPLLLIIFWWLDYQSNCSVGSSTVNTSQIQYWYLYWYHTPLGTCTSPVKYNLPIKYNTRSPVLDYSILVSNYQFIKQCYYSTRRENNSLVPIIHVRAVLEIRNILTSFLVMEYSYYCLMISNLLLFGAWIEMTISFSTIFIYWPTYLYFSGARMPSYPQIYPSPNITQESPKWNPVMRNDHSALRNSIFSSAGVNLGALQLTHDNLQTGSTWQGAPESSCALSLLSSNTSSVAITMGHPLSPQLSLHENELRAGINAMHSSENVSLAGFRYCNGLCPYPVGEGSENGSGHSLPFSWQW